MERWKSTCAAWKHPCFRFTLWHWARNKRFYNYDYDALSRWWTPQNASFKSSRTFYQMMHIQVRKTFINNTMSQRHKEESNGMRPRKFTQDVSSKVKIVLSQVEGPNCTVRIKSFCSQLTDVMLIDADHRCVKLWWYMRMARWQRWSIVGGCFCCICPVKKMRNPQNMCCTELLNRANCSQAG